MKRARNRSHIQVQPLTPARYQLNQRVRDHVGGVSTLIIPRVKESVESPTSVSHGPIEVNIIGGIFLML